MPHPTLPAFPTFENPAEDLAPLSWWRILRDLGIALVVVAAAGLIGGFVLLSA